MISPWAFFIFSMALSVVTLNCNGIRDCSKRTGLLQWLRLLPASVDIVCLQETHCVSASECSSWFLSSGLSFALSPGTNKSCGCIVLFRPSLSFVDSWSDSEGRFLQCEFSLRDVRFRVACVYAPNRNPARDHFFDDVATNIVPSIPSLPVGDFNSVFDRAVDRCGSCVSDTSRESSVALSPGTNKSCGCIVLFRPSLSFVDSWSDSEGRFLQCEFSLRDVRFRVACVYAPNRNPARDHFFDDVATNIVPSIPSLPVGDFNSVFDRAVDRCDSCVSDTSRESSVALARLFESSCCIDVWRYLHPSSACFTWSRWEGLLSSRIDLIGCPYIWISSVSACDILPCPFSDHCAVRLSLTVPCCSPWTWALEA